MYIEIAPLIELLNDHYYPKQYSSMYLQSEGQATVIHPGFTRHQQNVATHVLVKATIHVQLVCLEHVAFQQIA